MSAALHLLFLCVILRKNFFRPLLFLEKHYYALQTNINSISYLVQAEGTWYWVMSAGNELIPQIFFQHSLYIFGQKIGYVLEKYGKIKHCFIVKLLDRWIGWHLCKESMLFFLFPKRVLDITLQCRNFVLLATILASASTTEIFPLHF